MSGIREYLDQLLSSKEEKKAPSISEYLDELVSSSKENRVRAPDRNPLVGAQADLAKKVKALLNQYETKKLGNIDSPWNKYGAGHEIGSLLFGESPELLDDISYGKNPLTSGGRTGRIPIPDKRLLDMPVPIPATGGLGVIKNEGQNWLTGSVENALKRLKIPLQAADMGIEPESNTVKRSVNSWVDGPLTKYVKNRMATPSDEVRKLADQGILHYTPYHPDEYGLSLRSDVGFPEEGLAKTNLGRDWEYSTDTGIIPLTAGERRIKSQGSFDKGFPELSRVKDDEMVYQPLSSIGGQQLGIPHLIDELLNATSPDSGLPMNLRMKPEGFKGLTMEEAVKKVQGINTFRAEQAKKVNERFAQAEGIPVYKDYGDGTRLLEYKLPDEDPKGYRKGIGEGYFDEKGEYWPDSAITEKKREQLESWLKQEGDTMGHCVGGYCDKVTSGQSRILSLRDKEGKSRATIELRPEKKLTTAFDYLDQNHVDYLNRNYDLSSDKLTTKDVSDLLSNDPLWLKYNSNPTPVSIVQIKGPGNKPPDKDVLPYLQDFVKSGNWLDVRDLQNAGLERLTDYKESVIKRAREAGIEGDYLTAEEVMKYLDPIR